jgi:hypothetical protein
MLLALSVELCRASAMRLRDPVASPRVNLMANTRLFSPSVTYSTLCTWR